MNSRWDPGPSDMKSSLRLIPFSTTRTGEEPGGILKGSRQGRHKVRSVRGVLITLFPCRSPLDWSQMNDGFVTVTFPPGGKTVGSIRGIL